MSTDLKKTSLRINCYIVFMMVVLLKIFLYRFSREKGRKADAIYRKLVVYFLTPKYSLDQWEAGLNFLIAHSLSAGWARSTFRRLLNHILTSSAPSSTLKIIYFYLVLRLVKYEIKPIFKLVKVIYQKLLKHLHWPMLWTSPTNRDNYSTLL